jgi:multiple sugar transport system substrate-binding protein
MVKRFRKFILFSMIIALFLMTACGGSANNSSGTGNGNEKGADVQTTPAKDPTNNQKPEEAEIDKTPVTISVLTWVDPNRADWKAHREKFTEKYPWITVEWLHTGKLMPTQYMQKRIAAGDPVDVFWDFTSHEAIRGNYAEDLTPWIAKDKEFQEYKFLEGINEPFKVDGKQYGLSRGNDSFVIYYNKDLLKQYGLQAPTKDWTWEDLKEMAKKATNPAAGHYGIGGANIWFEYGAPSMVLSNGHSGSNRLLNKEKTEMLATPEVLDDLQWMLDWIVKDEIMLNPKRVKEKGIEGDLWATGNALFNLHVSPVIAGYKKSLKFDWDIAPFPRGTVSQESVSLNNPMFIAKASKKKEAAWLFMKWWSASLEGQKGLMDIGGTLPNSDHPEIVEHFNNIELYKGLDKEALLYAAKIGEADPFSYMIGGNIVQDALRGWASLTGKGFAEEVSAYDYFPNVVEKVNKDLAEEIKKYK